MDDQKYALTATDEPIVKQVGLKKSVSAFSAAVFVVGSIIGSGIFISTSDTLMECGSVGASLLIWLACGFISTFGALCFAELGTAIPKSGGEYSYLLDAFGPLPAFLFSWASIILIRPASVAIIALTFAEYVIKPFFPSCPANEHVVKIIAFLCIALVTLLNCASVKLAIKMNNILTYSKLICIAIVVTIGMIQLGRGGTHNFSEPFKGTTNNAGSMALAFYYGLWAYDGWHNLNYVTEEMKNPTRDLPRAILGGIVTVTICYMLCNVAYIACLGKDGILSSPAVALSIGTIFMKPASWIIPVLVAASAFGAANATVLANGRLVYTSAREGHMMELLAMVHASKFTPLPSLLFTSLMSSILLIPDAASLSMLVEFFNFSSWLFYGMCFIALIYMRYSQPDLPRPYRVWIGVPIFMTGVSLYLIIAPFFYKLMGTLTALLIILSGIPIYFIFVVYHHKLPSFIDKTMQKMTYINAALCNLSYPESVSAIEC